MEKGRNLFNMQLFLSLSLPSLHFCARNMLIHSLAVFTNVYPWQGLENTPDWSPVHHRASTQRNTNTRWCLVAPIGLTVCLWTCEDTGTQSGNPQGHRKDMQTPPGLWNTTLLLLVVRILLCTAHQEHVKFHELSHFLPRTYMFMTDAKKKTLQTLFQTAGISKIV